MTANLVEAIRARRDPSPRSVAVFAKAGIDALSLAFDADGDPNPVSVDRVVFGFEQRFEYERDALLCATEACNAFVIAARDRDGIAADMLAWNPKRRPPFTSREKRSVRIRRLQATSRHRKRRALNRILSRRP